MASWGRQPWRHRGKGAIVADEVADRLVEFAGLLRDLPDPERDDHHASAGATG